MRIVWTVPCHQCPPPTRTIDKGQSQHGSESRQVLQLVAFRDIEGHVSFSGMIGDESFAVET